MSNAIHPKGPRQHTATTGPADWVRTYLTTSVGQKVLVGATGLLLVGFLVFHMIGNLKVFPGFEEASPAAVERATAAAAKLYPGEGEADARQRYVAEHAKAYDAQEHVDKYAAFLQHDLGALLWIARGGLLTLFLVHVFLALRLQWKAKAARPVQYAVHRYAQASPAARTMLSTGIVILVFTAIHLAHYTFGAVHRATLPGGATANYLDLQDADGRHDVYDMVVSGFTTPWISVFYIACQALLAVHLSWGIQSSLATLGLVGKRFTPAARWLGYVLATTIFLGNVAIVLGVWTGYVKPLAVVPG